MEKRPLSLTIIGWWLAISSVFGIYSLTTMGSNPTAVRMIEKMGMTMPVYLVIGAVGTVVTLICAYGILKGLPWARVLYAGWGIASLVHTFFASPIRALVLVGLLLLALILFFLFRPAADRWFQARGLQLHRSEM